METTKKQILQNKINDAVDYNKKSIDSNFNKFINIQENLNDNIIILNGNRPYIKYDHFTNNIRFIYNDIDNSIHQNALNQMCSKLNLPVSFINELATQDQWQKELAGKILTDYFKNTERNTVLLRNVGTEIRGFLSDKYKRINSLKLMQTFLKELQNNNFITYRFFSSDTNMYCEVINPNIIDIESNKETISLISGIQLKNSDFGCSAVEISSYLIQVVCLNGMVRKNAMREIHLGQKLSNDIEFSEKTLRLNTEATESAMFDVIKSLSSPEFQEKQIQLINKAVNTEVDNEKMIKKLPSNIINKKDVEGIKNILMNNKIEDGVYGENNLWKFTQAISAYGRNCEETKKRDIEQLSGKLLETVLID